MRAGYSEMKTLNALTDNKLIKLQINQEIYTTRRMYVYTSE